MRNKREEGRGTKSSTDCAVDKKKAVISKSTGRRNQENGGEMLVRYITSRDDADTEMNGFMKNPFTKNKLEDSSITEARASIDMEKCSAQEDFTKFHLEDDEMLLELMIHLHADCPDLMNDKTDLIERVSKLYDKIHVNTTP